MASKVWGRWSSALALAVEGDFARKAAPFLRLLWPTLVPTPARMKWDASGADYLTWAEEGPFECVVQCKGFHVQELTDDQVGQVKGSVEAMLAAPGFECRSYVLVHNRDGRFREFNTKIDVQLQRLVQAGRAARVEVLDRQQLLARARRALGARMEESIRATSERERDRMKSLFELEIPHLARIPLRRGDLRLRRYEAAEVVLGAQQHADAVGILIRDAAPGWTLLQGHFGAGKTTTALHAAGLKEKVVVVLRCADAQTSVIGQSLRLGLQRTVEDLVLAAVPDEDRAVIDELAASVLVQLLSGDEARDRYALIVDGLDENRSFATLAGLQGLVNQLVDLECNIVLTARSEHVNALFGNYSEALGDLAWKFGRGQVVQVVQLEPWDNSDALWLIDQTAGKLAGAKGERLRELASLIQSGRVAELYGDIPSNPLLLSFLVEDVATEGLRSRSRAALLRAWARRKLWRDAQARKDLLEPNADLLTFIDEVFGVTERIAGRMTVRGEGRWDLLETVSSDAIEQDVQDVFEDAPDPVLGLLLHSFLRPVGRRQGARLELAFAFRVFQEFFLASHLYRTGTSPAPYPDPVRELYGELAVG